MGSEVFKVKSEKDKIEISIPKKPKWYEWLGFISLNVVSAFYILLLLFGVLTFSGFALFRFLKSYDPFVFINFAFQKYLKL